MYQFVCDRNLPTMRARQNTLDWIGSQLSSCSNYKPHYTPINVKFGMEEYTMSSLAHAKFSLSGEAVWVGVPEI